MDFSGSTRSLLRAIIAAVALSALGVELGAVERRPCLEAQVLANASRMVLHAVQGGDRESVGLSITTLAEMVPRLQAISREKGGHTQSEIVLRRLSATAAALAESAERDGRRGLLAEFERIGAAGLMIDIPDMLEDALCGAYGFDPLHADPMTHAADRDGGKKSEWRALGRSETNDDIPGLGSTATAFQTIVGVVLAVTALVGAVVAVLTVAGIGLADRATRRAARRYQVAIAATALVDGRPAFVQIRNLSRNGAKLSLLGVPPAEGAIITVQIEDTVLKGRIVWAAMRLCGMEFDTELSGALLEKLLRLG